MVNNKHRKKGWETAREWMSLVLNTIWSATILPYSFEIDRTLKKQKRTYRLKRKGKNNMKCVLNIKTCLEGRSITLVVFTCSTANTVSLLIKMNSIWLICAQHSTCEFVCVYFCHSFDVRFSCVVVFCHQFFFLEEYFLIR